MFNTLFIILISFSISFIALLIQNTHFLMSLFCLEAMLLSSMMLLSLTSMLNMNNTPFMAMIMLTMGACEASLGLALMVMMSRYFGSDMINVMTTNKC